MKRYVGTQGGDVLGAADDQSYRIVGRAGSDVLRGGAGDDIIVGDGPTGEARTEVVTFKSAQGGYRSTLGMYEIDAAGNISNVHLVFENASISGTSTGQSAEFTVAPGSKVGFFILPDGFRYNSGLFDWVREDKIPSHYELRNGDASTPGNGNIHDGPLTLVWVDSQDGWTEKLKGASDYATFHSLPDLPSLNPDDVAHAQTHTAADGTVTISFEDLWAGGDHSFDDVTIEVTTAGPAQTGSNNDVMDGGCGNDLLIGGTGADVMNGGLGDDELRGGRGDDVLAGGIGHDKLYGGTGNDLFLMAGGGDDAVSGGKDFDTVSFAGMTSDVAADLASGTASYQDGTHGLSTVTLASIEALIGGGGNDKLSGSARDDVLSGGDGNDTLAGGRGSDTLTGGDGNDTFVFSRADLVGGAVDYITDFTIGQDRLDFSKLLNANVFATGRIGSFVHLHDTADGSIVQAKIGADWVDVVVLDHIHVDNILHLGI